MKKQKKDKIKGNSKKRKRIQFGVSIRTQLIIGFLIPILFCVTIGVISYAKASEGLIENYEKSAVTALQMTATSLDESMGMVAAMANELSQDPTIYSYALDDVDSDRTLKEQAKITIQQNLGVKRYFTEMIQDIYVIPIQGEEIISTRALGDNVSKKSFIDEFPDSENAIMVSNKRVQWGSKHSLIDEKLGVDDYILYCSICFTRGPLKSLAVIDISEENVLELLNQLDLGSGCYVSYIAADGAQISTDPDFKVADIEGIDLTKEMDYIEYKGQTYFYMTAKSYVSGGQLLALVPKAYITHSSDSIRDITVAMVVAACVVAILLSAIIIRGLSKNIKKSMVDLDKVSQGDLTVGEEEGKISHNEFGKLQMALNNTVEKMRELIGTVSNMKDEVMDAGDKVKDSGVELSTMTENVSAQIEEIDSIIATQNVAIANCNTRMEELSVQIKGVSGSIFSTIDEVTNSRKMIDEGMTMVEEMVNQSEQTADATREVWEQVTRLAEKMQQITKFVSDIQDIAEETNLLSLNASIEAARAGEQGKGFAVVAEEIRNLADGSAKTATEINKIIGEVISYSESAIGKVNEAGTISARQMESAKKTITAFEQMNTLMEGLVTNMQSISKDVDTMNTDRHEALEAIHGIGESSEHTVKATGEVNRFLEKQTESAEGLQRETAKMQKSMKQLEDAILTFKL